MSYNNFKLEPKGGVAWLALNRPTKANAMNLAFFDELPRVVAEIAGTESARVVVLYAEGPHFCAGIDLDAVGELLRFGKAEGCAAESRERLRDFIVKLQVAISALESLRVPVIAAIDGACVGGGVDLIAACDLRLATTQARFSIKEVDLAIVADLGSLQRLVPVLGYARLAELAYTAQEFDGATAERLGLVSRTFATRAELLAAAAELAQCIAAKSGITVRGLKRNLLYARDHDVASGLEYAAAWNSSALVSADLLRAIEAAGRRSAKPPR